MAEPTMADLIRRVHNLDHVVTELSESDRRSRGRLTELVKKVAKLDLCVQALLSRTEKLDEVAADLETRFA